MIKSRRQYKHLALLLIVILLSLPVIFISLSLLAGYSSTWTHIARFLLPSYVLYSLLIAVTVAIGASVLGLLSAWFVSMFEFPGRRILQWALMLPIALPAYIMAYIYTGIFVELDWSGIDHLRSWYGASAILTLVTYPYVYASCRIAFALQNQSVMETAQSLGSGIFDVFHRVALPLARPALIAGSSLVLMETLAEYGTMELFGIPTLTTGIFRVWFGYGELRTAAQLSALLFFVVVLVLVMERTSPHFNTNASATSPLKKTRLRPRYPYLLTAICCLPCFIGLIVPLVFLTKWVLTSLPAISAMNFFPALVTSFLMALVVVVICLGIALFSCYYRRLNPTRRNQVLLKSATFGYTFPGTVIAIGVLIPTLFFQNALINLFDELFGINPGLFLTGTLAALIIALVVRYLAVGVNTVKHALDSLKLELDHSAQSLGYSRKAIFWNIHRPLITPAIVAASILLFVDVVKELPATLILRPFNTSTLSVKVFEYASDERLLEASLPALTIVLISLFPVLFLNRLADN